jgi:tetratricopeptide (TPR) repeat protein
MKKISLFVLFFPLIIAVYGQDAKTFYEQGMEKAQAGKMEEAIGLFDKSIELKSDEYVAWYNRGIAKSKLFLYEDALLDFEQTVKLQPDYKKGYLNRGIAKKRLTDYMGALADYSYAIKLDANYADAFFNRGLLLELLSKRDSACLDFNKAHELGSKSASKKVESCDDTAKMTIYPILRLTKIASDDKYGFTAEKPVKVGRGPDGGPANQRVFLNLLRDAKGKSLKYQRVGSCCSYKSENGFMGTATLDKYEIIYLDVKGNEQKATVFISFYDYEEPQILSGFKTIGK